MQLKDVMEDNRHEGMHSHKVGVMFVQFVPSITDWERLDMTC
jgi:hypothetical protein